MKKGNKMGGKQALFALIITIILAAATVSAGGIIDTPIIDASLAYQDPDPVEPGDEVELRFSIKNTGSSTAKSTEFAMETSYPFTISPGEDEIKSLGDIKIYESEEIITGESSIRFKVYVDQDALEGSYDLTLKYRTEEGISRGQWIETDPFILTVGSKGTHLVLQQSTTDPETVSPGQNAKLTLTFSNEGNTALEGITVGVNLDDLSEISPTGTGTELIIQKIKPGETGEAVFSFILAPDAEIKVYKVPLDLEYEDARGTDYEKTTHTSIIAAAQPEYILNLEESDVYKKKESGNVVISLSNIGVGDINYATITLKENDYYTILSPDAVYLGNLESDDFETAQFTLYTNHYAEEIPLEFTLFYKDNYNKNYEEEITLQMKLFTSGEAKRYGLVEPGNSWIILLLLITAGAGYYWWKYKRKKKGK
jgi:hypothetical protein